MSKFNECIGKVCKTCKVCGKWSNWHKDPFQGIGRATSHEYELFNELWEGSFLPEKPIGSPADIKIIDDIEERLDSFYDNLEPLPFDLFSSLHWKK